jgi:REP element-mobilizing transposase RayT
MGDLLGYLLTWTCYGTWLPGDARGWVNRHRTHGEKADLPQPALAEHAHGTLDEPPLVLSDRMRFPVDQAIRTTSDQLAWDIHALQVRTNHVHVVVTAAGIAPTKVMGILKVASTRALRPVSGRQRYWTASGSMRHLRSSESLSKAIEYVNNQDRRDGHG